MVLSSVMTVDPKQQYQIGCSEIVVSLESKRFFFELMVDDGRSVDET